MPDTDIKDKIASAAVAVARHVHDGGFEAVIVSGASHQLSRSLLALGWNALYPGTPLPRVFALGDDANALLYKINVPNEPPHEFGEWMHANAPDLEAARDSKLCLVDDFAIGGYKYNGVRESLRQLGFRDVGFAFFSAMGDTKLGEDAFVGIRSEQVTAELHRLSQNIQDFPEADQLLRREFGAVVERYREQALNELREVGARMRK